MTSTRSAAALWCRNTGYKGYVQQPTVAHISSINVTAYTVFSARSCMAPERFRILYFVYLFWIKEQENNCCYFVLISYIYT